MFCIPDVPFLRYISSEERERVYGQVFDLGTYNNTHSIEESIKICMQSGIQATNVDFNEIITKLKVICFLNREYFKSYCF